MRRRMGIEFKINSHEEMCDAMCDNVLIDKGTPYGVRYTHEEGRNMAMNSSSARAQRYQDKAIRRFIVKVNRFTEIDILEHLEKQESFQGYIKRLVREDIERNK